MKWHRSTLAVALLGSFLMWAAQPPLALGLLAWIAPVPWLLLVRADELTGRRPYWTIWLAGLVFWLMAIHWLRLPHPATSLGWLALSAYLACYLPVFVGLSRVAVHRLRVPLWLAAPVVWTGLELARAHLLTGFLMASLAHTQVHWTPLIQLSDLVGEYGVDFLVMAVAASIAECGMRIAECGVPRSVRSCLSILVPLVPAVILLAAALGYGYWRLAELDRLAKIPPPGPRVALIQGNSLADWKADLDKQQQIMNEYIGLSYEALAKAREAGDDRPIDLVVWPETMFRSGLASFEPDFQLPPNAVRTTEEIASYGPRDLASLVRQLDTPVLVGIDRVHYLTSPVENTQPRYLAYNSAVLVDRDGNILGTYDKVHRVMFGEYIPFADWLPSLYGLTPLAGGIQAGDKPVILEIDGWRYAPNICYETVIPHVIRRQAATLVDGGSAELAAGRPADVLVNLTNDAWYWGASELDMHLACDVFRAVETRKPMLVAANGGISAWIDHRGRIRAQSPRQQADVILADVEPGTPSLSFYVRWGDWFAGLCLTACVLLAVVGLYNRRRSQRTTDDQRRDHDR